MNKEKLTKFISGFLVYSALYFIVGYFFKLPNMCYDNLKEWSCLGKSLGQTAFFGIFMMVFDFFILKKFSGNKDLKKKQPFQKKIISIIINKTTAFKKFKDNFKQ